MDKQFRIIAGTYPYEISRGPLTIVAAFPDNQPFPVDAAAFEEDTFLVLSAETSVREPKGPLVRVMTKVIETHPETPGSVLVKDNHPVRLLVVVHDLNQEPTWKEEWVQKALAGIFQEVELRGITSLALPFIGTLYGTLGKERFLRLLRALLQDMEFKHLGKLWLIVPPKTKRRMVQVLEPRS
jgi:hypothetical protein